MNQEIIDKLKSDPLYLFSVMSENNPEAIAANLRGMGFPAMAEPENVYNYLFQLYNARRGDMLQKALNAPYRTDRTPGYFDLMKQAGIVQTTKSGAAGESAAQQSGSAASTGSTWSWAAALGAIPAIASIITGNPVPGTSGTGTQQAPTKSNAIWWLLGFFLLLVLIVVIVIVTRKGKKENPK